MIKILHVEDNVNDYLLLETELKRQIEGLVFKRVEDEEGLNNCLITYDPDVVISDYSMPGFDGMTALKICKEFDPSIPFIILTGTISEDTAVECMKAGADDYVIKEHLKRITPAVHYALELRRLKTEKEKNEKALIESENRLALALEGTNAAIWDLNIPTGRFYFGSGIYRISGYSVNDFTEDGNLLRSKLIHKEDIEKTNSLLREHIAGDTERYESEYRLIRKDGKTIYVLERGKIVEFDKTKFPLRIAGTIIDISEKKKAERELLVAKEKAEEMNRLKTNFFANMSHEFRTPLNGILGMASILSETVKEDDKLKMLNDIIFSGKRLQNTLDSILEYSQLDSSFNSEKLRPVDLGNIVSVCVKECSALCRQKGIPIYFNPPQVPVVIKALEKYISIIIYNLLENSLKFTSQGQITVFISREQEEGANYGILKVTDTGIGILREHQEIIFQEFRQVSEGYGRYYEGAGLGLALIKKLVSLLNGAVSIESEYGVGSTFIVKIPLCVSQAAENETIASGLENSLELKKNKLLLIEDNLVNKDVVTLFLRKICEVDFANTGERGVMLARKNLYPAVIVDINLGSGMNGVEAAKAIRKIAGYENTPLIAVTGYAMHGDKEKLLSEGIDYYLAKPFEKKDLINIVTRALTS
jgi:PAS domain S-box-containing protein